MVAAVQHQASVHVQKATQDLSATGVSKLNINSIAPIRTTPCIQLFVIHRVKMELHAHRISDVTVLLDGPEMFVMKVEKMFFIHFAKYYVGRTLLK